MRHTLLRTLLAEGEDVVLSFAGISMLPLITGSNDRIVLHPLPPDQTPRVGEVYLFQTPDDRFVVHRLIRMPSRRHPYYLFRGDNNIASEQVQRCDILAHLVEVHHADGTTLRTDSDPWQRLSRRLLRRRQLLVGCHTILSASGRSRLRPYYFAALLILMWAPLNGLGVPLDNFVFGIRLDHLLHASVFIPCAFFLYALRRRPSGRPIPSLLAAWPLAALVGLVTEWVQYLLPYRGFDINDMVSNFFGVTVGWLLCWFGYRKYHKTNH